LMSLKFTVSCYVLCVGTELETPATFHAASVLKISRPLLTVRIALFIYWEKDKNTPKNKLCGPGFSKCSEVVLLSLLDEDVPLENCKIVLSS